MYIILATNSNQFEFVGPVAGTKFWSLRLDFVAKIASSHDGTSGTIAEYPAHLFTCVGVL